MQAQQLPKPCSVPAQGSDRTPSSTIGPSFVDNCKFFATAPQPLPVLELPRGWTADQALKTPDWLTVSFSALSQNNGTLSGLEKSEWSSSNLFNLGIRLVPFQGIRSKSVEDIEAPRQGVDLGDRFYENIAINVLFTQRTGQILSSEIPNQLNTQWNFGNGPVGRLGFLNLEYKSESSFVSLIRLGKLMQAQDFTVDPVQCYFANFGFCGWAQGVPAMISIPGNPFNSYGAVVAFGDKMKVNFRYGIYQIAPETFAPDLHGLDFSFNKGIGVAHFAELRIPIAIDSRIPVHYDDEQMLVKLSGWKQANHVYQSLLPAGTITLGGWFGTGAYPTVLDSKVTEDQNSGAYGIVSFKIPGVTFGLDHRVFVSAGFGFTPNVQDFLSGGSAGLVIAGLIPQRPFDTLSLGTSYASFNPDYVLPGLKPGSFSPATEWALELNYSWNITQSVRIMPNIQLLINPGGESGRGPVVVGGLQVWYLF
jgi:hypothetical protein